MIIEQIKDGLILFISLICGLYVLEHAPKDSIYYKALILLCMAYLGVVLFGWVNHFKNNEEP